jgi:sigma-B regulation protein RsbU (phosphoserine phosphatase)
MIDRNLGDLVLRNYTGLENGIYSYYPCAAPATVIRDTSTDQFWYRSAMAENLTSWSRPYVDPLSGKAVMAVSYPLEDRNERPYGVTSLIVPLDLLLEAVLPATGVDEKRTAFIGTRTAAPANGTAGIRVLVIAGDKAQGQVPGFLHIADSEQFDAVLADIALHKSGIRQLPFDGRPSYWAYKSLAHQGTALFMITPDIEPTYASQPIFATIEKNLHRVQTLTAGFLILLIIAVALVAIRFSKTVTRPLEKLSEASKRLAAGDFDTRIDIRSNDEFSRMGQIFNRVGPQLKEFTRTRQSLEVAMQIQQKLLPESAPQIDGFDVYGMTLYSEKTGGDYFDYLCVNEKNRQQACVTVGDVVDHGIPSALLMANVRGMLRLRSTLGGELGQIITDVNHSFARDVEGSGQFMTMFLARLDREAQKIEWVRAGHEPALLYDPARNRFKTLKGTGLPLGVTADSVYDVSSCAIDRGQIVVMGTDGIWESFNETGEQFGKQRLKQVIRENAAETAQSIVLAIFDAVEEFRGAARQEDDLTLVVIKVLDN